MGLSVKKQEKNSCVVAEVGIKSDAGQRDRVFTCFEKSGGSEGEGDNVQTTAALGRGTEQAAEQSRDVAKCFPLRKLINDFLIQGELLIKRLSRCEENNL